MERAKKNFKIYLSLGSNLGDRMNNIENAIDQINKELGEVNKISSFYETPSWGFNSSNDFLNVTLELISSLTPEETLIKIQEIETGIGRDRSVIKSHEMDYHDRIIDIDIIDFEGEVRNEKKLTLPHPKFHMRKFVLIPLHEIAPKYAHPLTNQGIEKLIEICADNSEVRKV